MDTPPTSFGTETDQQRGTASDDFDSQSAEMTDRQLDVRPEQMDTDLEAPSRCNVGRTEQKFRLGVGAAMLTAAAFAPVSRGWRIGLAVLGAAEIVTGTTRYCPVSKMLGINTCRPGEE